MSVVLDSSAVMTLLLKRPGDDKVKALVAEKSNRVYMHRQNVTEVRYIMHQRYALAAFLAQHPERVHPNSNERPDLTGLDLGDPQVFDSQVATLKADQTIRDLTDS